MHPINAIFGVTKDKMCGFQEKGIEKMEKWRISPFFIFK